MISIQIVVVSVWVLQSEKLGSIMGKTSIHWFEKVSFVLNNPKLSDQVILLQSPVKDALH